MGFNDLLKRHEIDPESVLVLRYHPKEKELLKVMPWLITEKPTRFNAYQQTQSLRGEKQMSRSQFVASFFGHTLDKAAFVGLYERKGQSLVTRKQLHRKPAHRDLLKYAHDDSAPKRLWFNLKPTDFLSDWQGKLIIRWPRPAIVFARWAHQNEFLVDSILEESVFQSQLDDWRALVFSWDELHLIPKHWKDMLSLWHGIYYIWDGKDGKGYVGAAYGKRRIYGRWINYRDTGDGGNKLLRPRKPDEFQFCILEWMPSDIEKDEVFRRERLWKDRLHSRAPFGLNAN